MPAAEPDALAAALLTLAGHAGRLSELDARQHAAADQIAALTGLASGMKATLDDQAEILAALAAPDGSGGDDGDGGQPEYRPGPAPRFWRMAGPDRDQAVARLRAWVDQVYRPGYGQLAAALGPCWDQHPLCLYTLDWLSELWSALYLQPRRDAGTLAGQAEWQTRLLEAAAGQMARETARCGHARAQARALP